MSDAPFTTLSSADQVDSLAAPVAYRLANAPMRSWPFPHMEIEELLPDQLFRAVRAADLANRVAVRPSSRPTPSREYNPARYFLRLTEPDGSGIAGLPPEVATMLEVLSRPVVVSMLMSRFRPVIAKRFGGRVPRCYVQAEYLDDRNGYVLRPHTDVPQKLVTVLLYFADDDADTELGTALYQPLRDRQLPFDTPTPRSYSTSEMAEVYRVPYRPNRALVFAPTHNSLHGVPAIVDPTHSRRLLQYQLICVTEPAASASTA